LNRVADLILAGLPHGVSSNHYSRAFSCSSVVSRLASDSSIPPNVAFHL
jgi:hypothetical protein